MERLRRQFISILLIAICFLLTFFSLSIAAEYIPPLGPILSRGLMSEAGPDWECHCPASIWDCICRYNP